MKAHGSVGEQVAETFTERLVMEVAGREAIEPLDLPPLYDVIDPEAVEAVMTDTVTGEARDGICLEFSYYGYEIIVEGENIHVTSQ